MDLFLNSEIHFDLPKINVSILGRSNPTVIKHNQETEFLLQVEHSN